MILIKYRHPFAGCNINGSLIGFYLAADDLEESGFTGTIGTDDTIAVSFCETDVHFVEQMSDNPLNTIGDSAKLASAMQGFLAAAVDFTGAGGTVCIEATPEVDKVVIRMSATGDGSNPATDISRASKILRLHGATVSLQTSSEQGFLLQCDVPVA